MRFRLPRRVLSRLRDLTLTTLLADHLMAGLGSWLALTAGLAIAAAVTFAMATAASTHAKAVTTENRLNAIAGDYLSRSGGTISGDLHISGTLYGAAGTLTCGDSLYVAHAMTAGNTITTHANFNGATTTGVGGQGSILSDEYTAGIPGGGAFTPSANTWLLNWRSAYNAHVADTQGIINRVNDLLSALG